MTIEAAVSDQTSAVFVLLRLTARLFWRFWPQLMVVWLLGRLSYAILIEIAVRIGLLNHLAGLVTLTLVVVTKLIIVVAMFNTVRPGLIALDDAAKNTSHTPEQPAAERGASHFASTLSLSLVPFFAYYAAWGFLGDAVREYSKLALYLNPFAETIILDVSGGWWLVVSVVVAWIVRRAAKFMQARSKASIWPIIIVICEANWIFIGLFVISDWMEILITWLATAPDLIGGFAGVFQAVGRAAAASLPPPVEQTSQGFLAAISGLFFYALYPVVWLTLAAIIYGYEVHGLDEPAEGRAARLLAHWRSAPKSVRDFVGHFIDGTVARYRALANGIKLTLSAGLDLIIAVIVFYRLLDWMAAWAWRGGVEVLGAQDVELWQVLAGGLSLLFGSPSMPGDGILVEPLKVCLLAATLEIAFRKGGRWRRSLS